MSEAVFLREGCRDPGNRRDYGQLQHGDEDERRGTSQNHEDYDEIVALQDQGDSGQGERHDTKGDETACHISPALPIALSNPSDENVVDRNLGEDDEHKGE